MKSESSLKPGDSCLIAGHSKQGLMSELSLDSSQLPASWRTSTELKKRSVKQLYCDHKVVTLLSQLTVRYTGCSFSPFSMHNTFKMYYFSKKLSRIIKNLRRISKINFKTI